MGEMASSRPLFGFPGGHLSQGCSQASDSVVGAPELGHLCLMRTLLTERLVAPLPPPSASQHSSESEGFPIQPPFTNVRETWWPVGPLLLPAAPPLSLQRCSPDKSLALVLSTWRLLPRG